MDEKVNPTAQYVFVYTIAPLPGMSEKELERGLREEVLPKFSPSTRTINVLNLDSFLLKSDNAHRVDKYMWHIRLLEVALIGRDIKEFAGYRGDFDHLVREALKGFGLPISLTILREVANVRRT